MLTVFFSNACVTLNETLFAVTLKLSMVEKFELFYCMTVASHMSSYFCW